MRLPKREESLMLKEGVFVLFNCFDVAVALNLAWILHTHALFDTHLLAFFVLFDWTFSLMTYPLYEVI